jgi:hypothetical protein
MLRARALGLPNAEFLDMNTFKTFVSTLLYEGLTPSQLLTDLMAVGFFAQDLMVQIHPFCALALLLPGRGKSDGPESIG